MAGLKREDAIRLVRKVVAGTHVVGPQGSETKLPAVLDPANFNPPEWIIEAVQRAYALGTTDTVAAVLA